MIASQYRMQCIVQEKNRHVDLSYKRMGAGQLHVRVLVISAYPRNASASIVKTSITILTRSIHNEVGKKRVENSG